MGMNKEWEAVKDFHDKFDHPVSETPVLMAKERAEKRYKWMLEEIDEFLEATDITEQADAMIDTIYFALGTLVEMGVVPEPLFNIVQHANMSKLWEDGKPHYNADGKTIKPEGWEDPHEKLKKAIEAMK
ncbi:MAG: HAD family hydrolase [Erysipelothrix sp.]|nr:HAD family hydrolase [Erysipelothrix sp.]